MYKRNLFILVMLFMSLAMLVVACNEIGRLTKVPKTEPIKIDEVEVQEDTDSTVYDELFVTLPDSFKRHVALGIPYDSDTTDDYLIFRSQYVLSYNAEKGVSNWASWELDSSWFGSSGRYSGNFITDKSLPDSFLKIKHADYTNTGFDRGHIVRSQERTKTVEDNKSTFLMTNILPQTPDLNRGVWLAFERFCEKQSLDSGYFLYIIAGGVYSQGRTLHDEGKVAIPDSCFKIVLTIRNPERIIDSTASVNAVLMPNEDGIRNDEWQKYKTSVSHIEQSTGYTFFSELNADLRNWFKK